MFQLKSVSEMRNEELMSFKLKWSFHIIRIKLKYDSHSYFSGQKKSRLSHRLDSRDHLYSFELLNVKHESNQKTWMWQNWQSHQYRQVRWNPCDLNLMRWRERPVYHSGRRGGARCNVLCFTARGVCLVFRSHLCLISPAVQHQPPPTWDGHTTCHPHMRHGAWGEGSTCGISPVTRIQIESMNGCSRELSRALVSALTRVVTNCRVTGCWERDSVTYNLWCGQRAGHSAVTQTRQVWSFNLLYSDSKH